MSLLGWDHNSKVQYSAFQNLGLLNSRFRSSGFKIQILKNHKNKNENN